MNLKSLEKSDFSIVALCIACMFMSSAWITYDVLFGTPYGAGSIRIGKITSLDNHVKRKFDQSLTWQKAATNNTIFQNDWIFTGSNSQVIITLDKGGEIQLDADSLVVLSKKGGLLQLNLQQGSFSAKLKKGDFLNIVHQGKTKRIQAAAHPIKITQKNTSGQIHIQQKKTTASAEKATNKKFIRLLHPENSKPRWFSKTTHTTFRWESSEDIENYTLELSQKEDFSNPIKQNIYGTTSQSIKLPLIGKIFWRVRTTQNEEPFTSKTFSFQAKLNIPPTPLAPENSQSFSFPVKRGDTPKIDFKWADQYKNWDSFDFQISKEANFTEPLIEDHVEENQYKIEITENGTYFWRIRGQNSNDDITSEWTPPQKLNLNLKWPRDIPALHLVQKKIKYPILKNDFKKILADKTMPTEHRKHKLSIRWKQEETVPKYKISFSRDPNFEELIHEDETTEKFLTLDFIPIGKTYFRVQPLLENEDYSPPVDGEILSQFPTPVITPTELKKKNFHTQWSRLPGLVEYQVQYTNKKGTAKPKNLFLQETSVQIQNTSNFLTWKVRAVDPLTKEKLSPFSKKDTWFKKGDPYKKNYLAKKSRESRSLSSEAAGKYYPKILRPAVRKTFILLDDAPAFFVMEWDFKSKADGYDIEISRSPAMADPVIEKSIGKRNKTIISGHIDEGIYYLRMRAKEKDFPKAWSNIQKFRVIRKKSNP